MLMRNSTRIEFRLEDAQDPSQASQDTVFFLVIVHSCWPKPLRKLCYMMFERSLEVKLPTIWTDGKAEVGRVREEKIRKKIREEKESEERRCRCAKT